jgi:hypothetical protein
LTSTANHGEQYHPLPKHKNPSKKPETNTDGTTPKTHTHANKRQQRVHGTKTKKKSISFSLRFPPPTHHRGDDAHQRAYSSDHRRGIHPHNLPSRATTKHGGGAPAPPNVADVCIRPSPLFPSPPPHPTCPRYSKITKKNTKTVLSTTIGDLFHLTGTRCVHAVIPYLVVAQSNQPRGYLPFLYKTSWPKNIYIRSARIICQNSICVGYRAENKLAALFVVPILSTA